MKRIELLFMVLLIPLSVNASHGWTDIDICEVYVDRLPPGITLEKLPEAHSSGARLLNQYCTQCHNLPGPDRHSAAEWSDVTTKMFNLMEVSNRFGGLMGRVVSMQPQQQKKLLSYLQRHATNLVISEKSVDSHSWLTRTLALFPFLLLSGLGLLRWWHKSKHRKSKHRHTTHAL